MSVGTFLKSPAFRNTLMAGAGIGGVYLLYKKFKPSRDLDKPAPGSPSAPGAPGSPSSTLKPVAAGEKVATRSTAFISKKRPGYKYIRTINSKAATGEVLRSFTSPFNALYTGNVLSDGKGRFWAEVQPT